MSNPLQKKPQTGVSTSIHIVITAFIGIVVTALCCYAFYVFRTGMAKEQSIADAMKVIQASTEIVSSMAERGLPAIRGRLDELESRGRLLEKTQRETLTRLATASATAPVPHVESGESEAAILEARRAARAARQ